eukprot:TRINITY_DN74594_c0_g1_i1.p2 TRINITY_DN74594_c0_g1~~TRINITY_DN74594_c0_g1_i1.p2  ORF type:complete len:134 (+),score=19.80 TRINITY_DN74594_c0_g1_i1:103-504(+)
MSGSGGNLMVTKEQGEQLEAARERLQNAHDAHEQLSRRVQQLQLQEKRLTLAQQTLEPLSADTNMYRSIGKLFVKTPSESVKSKLTTQLEESQSSRAALAESLAKAHTDLEAAKSSFEALYTRIRQEAQKRSG